MAESEKELFPEAPADATVDTIARSIDLSDPALSLSYGAGTMDKIAGFADSILDQVKARDAGPVGDYLTQLMTKVKSLDVSGLAQAQESFLKKIPLIGGLFDSVDNALAKYKTLAEQVEAISDKLDTAMVGLLRDIEVMDQLYKHNAEFHADLAAHIAAGRKRLAEAETKELPAARSKAEAETGTLAAQEVRDMVDRMHRFERRLHDLELSKAITLQTAPQIRLIQSNDQTLAEKIQTSILTTIPIWKSQLVLALSLYNQKNALDLQKEVADTTNAMLRKNAEMLETNAIETARQVERGVVDIETLKEVHGRLVHSIEETLDIAVKAKEQRREAEKELGLMESNLKESLSSLAARKNALALGQKGNI